LEDPIDDEDVPELLMALEQDRFFQAIAADGPESDEDASTDPFMLSQIQLHHGLIRLQRANASLREENASLHEEREDLVDHVNHGLRAYDRLQAATRAPQEHTSPQNGRQDRMLIAPHTIS
jgi:hypothetical protein